MGEPARTLQQQIDEAAEPVAQFWPMTGFVHHNPIHGLEHLPFDEAIREAKHLFGAEGYLPNQVYRGFYRDGRIRERSVERALRRVGPERDDAASRNVGPRRIAAVEVQRLHFLFGVDPIEPALLPWQFSGEGALERFRDDLPAPPSETPAAYLTELWRHLLSILDLADPLSGDAHESPESVESVEASTSIELPFRRTVSDWVGQLASASIVDAIDGQMIKWVAAFVDDGMAGWAMPGKESGFYASWRELASHDASGRLLGIESFREKVRSLPPEPEQAIERALRRLEIPETRWRDYLSRVLAQLPGWTGLIRWRELNPEDPTQEKCPIDVAHYLAVRLFYEVELTGVEARRHWRVDASVTAIVRYWEDRREAYDVAMGGMDPSIDANTKTVCRDAWRLFHLVPLLALSPDEFHLLSREDAVALLRWLDGFPPDRHGPVWLEAYEDSYRDDVLAKLAAHRGAHPDTSTRPLAQAAFCIDVRSEPFRRHLEDAGPYETLGFAGFFGIPMEHRVFDTEVSVALCPVLLTPQHATFEFPRAGHSQTLQSYAAGSRWSELGDQLFHNLKQNPIAAFMLVDVLGLFFSVRLIGKTLVRRPYEALIRASRRWFVRPVPTAMAIGVSEGDPPSVAGRPTSLTRGFTLDEQATFVENGLRTMGLTRTLGRFVVLCGHGGNSDNNPYFAALQCGACGGRPGDPNARAFAAMGNSPEVRRVVAEHGVPIPDDTWFLGAKHDTNTDRVTLYDLEDVPAGHLEDLRTLQRDLARGGAEQARERCGRIPGAPHNVTAERAYSHVEARSFDWANPRPEWGLSGNAGFIIGRRALTKGLDLQGRIFLNSYDPDPDPEGVILEKIMTAPLIVGEWISMEHYFSAADPWNYGSGSKVIHNVVSGVGVMLGGQSDLQTGLPLQTVKDGEIHYHEPMRLLTIIEANPTVIGAIIQKHEILKRLFHNQWVNLVALDPVTFEFHRYNPDATWAPVELAPVETTSRNEENL